MVHGPGVIRTSSMPLPAPGPEDVQPVFITRSSYDPSTPADKISVGDYGFKRNLRVNNEWRPKELDAQRTLNDITSKLEAVINNVPIPDAPITSNEGATFKDTGFFKLDAGSDYEIEHNFGQMPSRFLLLYSPVENPQQGDNVIYIHSGIHRNPVRVDLGTGWVDKYEWVGMTLQGTNLNKYITLHVAEDKVFGNTTEGYIRGLLWR